MNVIKIVKSKVSLADTVASSLVRCTFGDFKGELKIENKEKKTSNLKLPHLLCGETSVGKTLRITIGKM